MYYRRGFYPRPGQADVPDELWAELQRIRGHLTALDQNNFDQLTLSRDRIVSPDDAEHAGPSDIVDEDGGFLYSVAYPNEEISIYDRWIDLSTYGVSLQAHSRGDAPWIVGASLDISARDTSSSPSTGPADDTGDLSYSPSDGPPDYVSKASSINTLLRIKTSQGEAAAESVGGLDHFVKGCSIAVVSCVFASGGPVTFSPMLMLDRPARADKRVVPKLHKANIFAFGLYR